MAALAAAAGCLLTPSQLPIMGGLLLCCNVVFQPSVSPHQQPHYPMPMLHPLPLLQSVIRQNLVLAVGSILALSLPTVLGWVPLWFAVMLHEGSTLLVALNSLRLLASGAPRSSSASKGSRGQGAKAQQQQQQHVHQHDHSHSHEEEAEGGEPAAVHAASAQLVVPPAA